MVRDVVNEPHRLFSADLVTAQPRPLITRADASHVGEAVKIALDVLVPCLPRSKECSVPRLTVGLRRHRLNLLETVNIPDKNGNKSKVRSPR